MLRSIQEAYLVLLARRREAAFKGISATRRCERPSCSMPICTACASISTWREMVAIKSSRRESSSAGVRSVRSWIRTSCRRSLALSALFFFPNKRSKKLISLPPRQSLKPLPEPLRLIQIEEWNFLTAQTLCNIAEGLARSAFRVEGDGCAAIRTNDDIFIFRHNADQFNR